jgi:hypothetical protein
MPDGHHHDTHSKLEELTHGVLTADTRQTLTATILEKLRAKAPVTEGELEAMRKYIDDLEKR